jgi:hypothetical protein
MPFSFRDWRAFFWVLPNSIEHLLVTISIKAGMLSSVSWFVHPVRGDRLDMQSWTVECSRQRISD